MGRKPATGLTRKIMIAMAAGLVLGVLINVFFSDVALVREQFVDSALKVVGAVFVAARKVMVVGGRVT